jgi:predicted PurR-regulated permease PerM
MKKGRESMKIKNHDMVVQKSTLKRLGLWYIFVAVVLMIPFLTKAPWTAGDFVFGGVVLFGFATIYELVTRKMNNKKHRIAVGFAILIAIMMVIAWAATGPD